MCPHDGQRSAHARGVKHDVTLQSGSMTIVLDKTAGTATLQRKVLFWVMKPIERPLCALVEARIHKNIDTASKAQMYSTMLVFREGSTWLLSARDKQDASDVVLRLNHPLLATVSSFPTAMEQAEPAVRRAAF